MQQSLLNTIILGHLDYERTLGYYLKYWCLSGFILCSLTPWLPDLPHQLLSYGWFISTTALLHKPISKGLFHNIIFK